MVRAFTAIVLIIITCGWTNTELGKHDTSSVATVAATDPVIPPTPPPSPPFIPSTVLLGPSEVRHGRLIIINAQFNVISGVDIKCLWNITPLPVDSPLIWPDGTKFAFCSDPDKDVIYKVQVFASSVIGQDHKIVLVEKTISSWEVVPPLPPPQPIPLVPPVPPPQPIPPTPPPQPIPPTPPAIPDGKYKLAQNVLDWLPQVVLDPIQKQADIAALAASFDSASKKVFASISATAAGVDPEIHNANEALALIKESNKAAIGMRRDAWLPWFISLESKLKELKLGLTKGSELQELGDGFYEISIGLSAAK